MGAHEFQAPDGLHVTGPIPNQVPVGETDTVEAAVQMGFVDLPGWHVVFTKFMGDFTFTAGEVSPDGMQATVVTDTDGLAQMAFLADGVGMGLIGVTVAGSDLPVAFSVFEIVEPPPGPGLRTLRRQAGQMEREIGP
jgi:hypothetical protein